MHYLMEDATLLMNKKRQRVSILIKGSEIRYIGKKLPKMTVIKMNVQDFTLTPSFVFFSPDIPSYSFDQFKSYFSNQYLQKGCGTLLTYFSINYHYEFGEKLHKLRLKLINSPLDYVIGLKLPASKLNPAIIAKCHSANISILFVEITNFDMFKEISWGWMKAAMFPQNPILIPIIPQSVGSVQKNRIIRNWQNILQEERINHIPRPLPIHKPLDMDILKKIGLYPKKGVLLQGGELSYNLFLNDKLKQIKDVEVITPDISVVKGKFTSINQSVFFHPGRGDEIVIRKTALYI